ncbi:MAG: hypothetical protein ACI3V3_04060 [Faecousia sp.]
MGADEIAIHVQQIEDRARSNTKRLDKLEQRQDNLDKLVSAVAGMQKDLEHTQGDVAEIKGDVKAMMDGPRKHWSSLIRAMITGVAGALVGALMTLILK